MFKVVKFSGAAILLAAATLVSAQTAPAPTTGFQFNGAGAVSCQEALPLLANPNAAPQFEQWFLGFLAAYNAYSSPAQRVSMPAPQALMAYASDVCKANPKVRFITVVSSALQQLGAKVPTLQ